MNALAVNTFLLCVSQAVSPCRVSASYLHLVHAHPSAVQQLRDSGDQDPEAKRKTKEVNQRFLTSGSAQLSDLVRGPPRL